MALLAGPTGTIHLKRSRKNIYMNKSLARPTGALALSKFFMTLQRNTFSAIPANIFKVFFI